MLLAPFNSVLGKYQAVKQLFIQSESTSFEEDTEAPYLWMPAMLSIPSTGCQVSLSIDCYHLNQLLQGSNQTLDR